MLRKGRTSIVLALILAFAMVLSQTVFAKAQTGQYQGAEAEPGSNLFQIRPIGTTDWEVAYCINLHAAYPTPEVKQDPNNPLTFDLSDDPSDLTKFTENKDPALTKQLLTVMWNGGPNDAAGLVSSKELTDVQLRTVTQYAIWHLTDNFNGARDLSGSMLQVYKVMIGASQSESLPFGKQFTMQQLPEGAKLNVFTPTNNIKPPSGYSQWQNLLSSQFLDRNDKPLKPTPSEPSNPGVEEKSVNFAKLDKATQQPVSGAKLRLERQLLNSTINGEAQDYDWTTDGNTATVKLAPGEYLIKELQVPQGYKPLVENAKTPIAQVIVTEEGTVTINSQTGVVYDGGIVKIFNESTASHDEHDVVISKTDIAGKEIAGAQIEVWSTGDDAKKLFDWTSVEGESKTIRLAEGAYVFKETVAPEGYTVVSDIKFSVDADGSVTTTDVQQTVDGKKIASTDGNTLTVIDEAEAPGVDNGSSRNLKWLVPLIGGGVLVGGLLAWNALSSNAVGSSGSSTGPSVGQPGSAPTTSPNANGAEAAQEAAKPSAHRDVANNEAKQHASQKTLANTGVELRLILLLASLLIAVGAVLVIRRKTA